jgi:23S rRNA pseudouridine2604 synthase
METRLNKYLSEAGYCSRREADRLIEEKRVTINDEIPELGQKVFDGDIVKVDGKVISSEEEFVYIALYKPIGITSTTDRKDPTNIVDFMKYRKRIFHVGRLDKDSEGLILMTNDGDIVNKILRANNNHEKEYVVQVDKRVTDQFLRDMSNGVPILGTMTKKCRVRRVNEHTFKITLTEGLNRQIRRMCSHFGYQVEKLKRIRIMNIKLDMPKGKWRYIEGEELDELMRLVESSVKTEEASK